MHGKACWLALLSVLVTLAFPLDGYARRIDVVLDSAGDGSEPFGAAADIGVDGFGNVYVVDEDHGTVFRISPGGVVTTILPSTGDGLGNTLSCTPSICHLHVTDAGDVYVTGGGSNNAFHVSPAGVVTEVIDAAGDGAGAGLFGPYGLATDSAGNLYVGGAANNNVFKVAPAGTVSLVLDSSGDGAGNSLAQPFEMIVDGTDNLFVVATTSNNVFRVTPAGAVSVVLDASGDGMGHPFDPLTTLARPAFDTAGNLWVPSSDTDLVFKITPAGAVSVALDATGDGLGNTMDRPLRPVPDTAGNVYVPDSDERVFRIDPAGTVTFLPRAVGGVVEIDASDNIYTRSLAPSVLRATSDDTAVALIDATGDGAAAVIFVDLFAVTGAGVVYATANTSSGHLVFRIEPLCPLHAQVGCRQPTVPLKSKLVFKDVSDDRKDQLSWKWVRGEATAAGAFGDPTVLDYTACAYDPAGHLVFEASIPSGADCAGTACWAPKGTVGFKYLDRDQAPDGIKKSILKAGDDGKAKLQLKGGGANLPDVSLPVGLPLTFQLAASNGECWQAVFSAAGAKKNADTKFVGRAD